MSENDPRIAYIDLEIVTTPSGYMVTAAGLDGFVYYSDPFPYEHQAYAAGRFCAQVLAGHLKLFVRKVEEVDPDLEP